MVDRVTEASGLKAAMAATPALHNVYCDMDEWIADANNLCFTSADGLDYGVFEYCYDMPPGIVTGHYFFQKARGKEAIRLSREIISIVFAEHDVKAIQGFTPVNHKGALWLNRQLGFKPYTIVNTEGGPCQFFVLTKQEWNNGQ